MAADLDDHQRLAGLLVDGSWRPVVERCRGDKALTRAVSRVATEFLLDRAARHLGAVQTQEAVWPAAEEAFVIFGALPGADGDRMAAALLDACTSEAIHGPMRDLRQDTVRWLLDRVPERVRRRIDRTDQQDFEQGLIVTYPFSHLGRSLVNAVWILPGEEGAGWLLRMLPQHDLMVSDCYRDMRGGRLPAWTARDWSTRLDALSDAHLDPRPRVLTWFSIDQSGAPPLESAPAQVRVACTYADAPTDPLVRKVAENLSGYRSGDPAGDARLFWWAAAQEQRDVLRWILELSGPAGTRERIVAAARAAGLIDEPGQHALAAPVERPAWVEHDVPWEVAEIREAGAVRLPDGRLAGGDPWWSFEGLPWVVQLDPGTYAVRVIIATHPLYGRKNAAAELLVSPEATPTRWELIKTTSLDGEHDGYVPQVNVASFGAAKALCPGLADALPDDIFGKVLTAEVDGGDAGSLVMFGVGEQHQECRTWAGLTAEGRIARLITDLRLIELDPTATPPPWH